MFGQGGAGAGASPSPRTGGAESELTNFWCRIRAHELWRWAAVGGANPSSRTFGADGAGPSSRMEFWDFGAGHMRPSSYQIRAETDPTFWHPSWANMAVGHCLTHPGSKRRSTIRLTIAASHAITIAAVLIVAAAKFELFRCTARRGSQIA